MNDEDKCRLRGNQDYLVQNLRVSDIQDYLVGEFIITDEESEVLSNRTRNVSSCDSARKLLVILRKSTEPNCFRIFCDALKAKGSEFIVEKLLKTDVGKIKEKIKREEKQRDDQLDKLNKQVWLQNEMMMQLKHDIDGMKQKVSAYDELEGKLKDQGLSSKAFVEMMARFMENGGFSGSAIEEAIEGSQPDMPVKLDGFIPQSGVCVEEHCVGEALCEADDSDEPFPSGRRSTAREIGKDIVFYLLAKKNNEAIHDPPNEYAVVMRKLVDTLIEANEDVFLTSLREVDLEKFVGFQAIINVYDELFAVGSNNWGRIATLYAYGGYIAMNSGFSIKDKSSWQRISTMGDFLGYYVDETLDPWIQEQGGWADFGTWHQRGDKSADGERSIWPTMLMLGGVGVGLLGMKVLAKN